MRRYILLIWILLMACCNNLLADEGMWLLPLIEKINMAKMKEIGLKLTDKDIYDINKSSIKDAIVLFGGVCTGEIISEEGLLLTNHHCGFSQVQNHSTVEHDYLKDGFWAWSKDEELPNPDLTVKFLIRIEDVSEEINKNLSDTLLEEERNEQILILSDTIEKEAVKETHYEAEVVSFYGGNYFYLCVYEVFKDIRLVGVPPSSIGKFGHDTDNWMWPRHTGDFSLFRVYCGPDGKPAEYSVDNIPYKPGYYLPISLKGVNMGDFAMVLGFSGSTDRYMSSFGVNELLEVTHPNRIMIRGLRQKILLEDMMKSQKIRIQYDSKYSRSSNYWKYSIGQSQGLKKLKIYDKKKELENEFTEWVSQNEERQKRYGEALTLIENAVKERKPFKCARQYLYESFFKASEIIFFANRARHLYLTMLNDPEDDEIIDSLLEVLSENSEKHFIDYNAPVDMKVTIAMLKLYHDNMPIEQHPGIYENIQNKFKGSFEKYVEMMFKKSIFADEVKYNKFLQNPSIKVLEKDPAFIASKSILKDYRSHIEQLTKINESFNKGHRLYIAGLMEMQKDRDFYPDANSTMRLTYGTVNDYSPRDAVHYNYFTTLEGVMEKEDTNDWDFIVPQKLKELYENKDYDRYGSDGIMSVCFTTNNDITGGNSGSPIINGDGQLIGLAFDGNWEAMSGDIVFEPKLQKCICVDIKYILFVIDKFAGAIHLIEELKLIN